MQVGTLSIPFISSITMFKISYHCTNRAYEKVPSLSFVKTFSTSKALIIIRMFFFDTKKAEKLGEPAAELLFCS